MNAPDEPETERPALDRFTEYRRTRARPLRNQLVEEHLPLAHSLARRYANRREPLDDLQQVAVLGLLKAVEGFDPIAVFRFLDMRSRRSPAKSGATSVIAVGWSACRAECRSSVFALIRS